METSINISTKLELPMASLQPNHPFQLRDINLSQESESEAHGSSGLNAVTGVHLLDEVQSSKFPCDRAENDLRLQLLSNAYTPRTSILHGQTHTQNGQPTVQSLQSIEEMLQFVKKVAYQLGTVEKSAPSMLALTANSFVRNLSPTVAELIRKLIVDTQNEKIFPRVLATLPTSPQQGAMGPPQERKIRLGARAGKSQLSS